MIDCFDGEYAFLSNFYDSPIQNGDIVFPTVEHYFQAQKTNDLEMQRKIAAAPTPGKAKQMGRRVELRGDWEDIKDHIMFVAIDKKFSIPELQEKLLATGDEELVEGNWWGDQYWGVCNGKGKNKLGKILMAKREQIKSSM